MGAAPSWPCSRTVKPAVLIAGTGNGPSAGWSWTFTVWLSMFGRTVRPPAGAAVPRLGPPV